MVAFLCGMLDGFPMQDFECFLLVGMLRVFPCGVSSGFPMWGFLCFSERIPLLMLSLFFPLNGRESDKISLFGTVPFCNKYNQLSHKQGGIRSFFQRGKLRQAPCATSTIYPLSCHSSTPTPTIYPLSYHH